MSTFGFVASILFFPSKGSKVKVPKVPAQVLTRFLNEGSQEKTAKQSKGLLGEVSHKVPSKVSQAEVPKYKFPSKDSQAKVPK